MTTYTGIDYGLGRSNIDKQTGIRFGVIAQHSLCPEAVDDCYTQGRDLSHEAAVADFQQAIARCESVAELAELLDERLHCRIPAKKWAAQLVTEDMFPLTEPIATVWAAIEDTFNDQYDDCGERDWLYERDGYKLTNCLRSDVMVLASPYFTYAQFCSPCVPGACNLDSPLDVIASDGLPMPSSLVMHDRCYCLGHDWFEGGKAPYPVYSVETGELVEH